MKALLSALFYLVLTAHTVFAHVRLIYPEPRKYQVDALGNRVPELGLCGMPRNESFTTDLQAGSTFNVTWNMGSPHPGGLRIELLDKNYNLVSLLVPKDGAAHEYFGDSPVVSNQLVTLPKDITCQNCILRLAKLGGVWIPPAFEYQMNSCADINIVDEDVATQCSGRGKWDGSTCQCDVPFAGSVCQFEDECTEDADCGGHGSCLDTQANSYPKQQCYCSFGWHGLGCAMESTVKTIDFKPESYHKVAAKFTNFTFYWRILDNIGEIEVVLVAQAKNYIAVGWRPSETNSSCKAFPYIPSETYKKMSADGQEVDTMIDYMDMKSAFFTAPLHPMSCNDITYVATRGNLSRFQDTYTRDQASPRVDAIFGGQDDLTAAIAVENPATNIVTALFRKKLIAKHPTDQSITKGMMHVIWAKGQEPYDPQMAAASAAADSLNAIGKSGSTKPSNEELIKEFFRKGELVTHAHDPKGRGIWEINLMTGV